MDVPHRGGTAVSGNAVSQRLGQVKEADGALFGVLFFV